LFISKYNVIAQAKSITILKTTLLPYASLPVYKAIGFGTEIKGDQVFSRVEKSVLM
jgi:hypothetical protein